jgi:hypothetical protein
MTLPFSYYKQVYKDSAVELEDGRVGKVAIL